MPPYGPGLGKFTWNSNDMLNLVFLFFIFLYPVNSAPVFNATALSPQGWEEPPASRGTLSILFSCGAALIVCVWTGVHLNVPPIEKAHKEIKQLSTFLDKLVWATIALLAPDIILVVALHQFLVAREYQNFVNKRSKTEKLKEKKLGILHKKHKRRMTLKMAYFATMGGFAVEVHNVNETRKFAVKIQDLNQLGMVDRIHDFPVSEVKDKSKVSTFAKTVACIQTAWVLLQCFGRQIDGLHITLLEVNTAVHVLVAIVVYSIWWEKPVEVSESILVLRRGSVDSSYNSYKDSVEEILKNTSDIIRTKFGQLPPLPPDPKIEHEHIKEPPPEKDDPRLTLPPGSYGPELSKEIQEEIKRNRKHEKHSAEKARRIAHVRAHEFRSNLKKFTAPGEQKIAQKLSMVLLVSCCVETAPAKAREMVELIPGEIRKYLLQKTKSDVVTSILAQKRTKDNPIFLVDSTIIKAAYTAAFREAYRAAFRAAHGEIHGLVSKITQNGILNRNTEKQLWALRNSLNQAFKGIRTRTFKASYYAAFKAAKVASNRLQGSSLPTVISLHTKTNPKDNLQVLIATVRAANAATRAASRQAIRLAALDESLGKEISAEATANALYTDLFAVSEHFQDQDVSGDIKQMVDLSYRTVYDTVIERFYDRYNRSTSRSGLGTEVSHTANFVEWASYSGIVNMIKKLIIEDLNNKVDCEIFKDTIDAVRKKLDGLDESTHHESNAHRSKIERFKGSLETKMTVLTNQIFLVPRLFQQNTSSDSMDKNQDPPFFNHSWRQTHRITLLIFSGLAGAFYGAIHATKWYSQWFPSRIEKLLWRSSCVIGATAFIPIILLFGLIFWLPLRFGGSGLRKRLRLSKTQKFLQILLVVLFCITLTLFIAARIFLVIEGLMSLRHLPPGAFQTVQWSEAIPHL